MKVRDFMTTQVFTVTPDTALRVVNQIFQRYGTNSILVEDGQQKILGIVTYSDLIRKIFPSYEQAMTDESIWLEPNIIEDHISGLITRPITEVMQKKVLTVKPDMYAIQAGAFMNAHHIKQVPVVENGLRIGLLGYKDLTWGFMLKNCSYF